ncbi:Nuclear pore assembly and biogenesis protein APQ12 [Penicillium macrosclerotiorum]|uniref:Nuclear pore assembly and biogenesis protein APQ12 n=1 Tax=Penicillium macrosclerotiorum TaxID=303699 RepID=UPI002547155D|nr:Nuclear pore assembly and biogenesis protein APQ12 [Penicillium macrosclerotiorum]KAJ5689872.1 Nuclear pore assembly and biogenesis protein APQ12 [Penicillium macrosclerotiorum]
MDALPENIQSILQHPIVSHLANSTQSHLTEQLTHLRSGFVQPYLISPLSTLLASLVSTGMPDLVTILLLAIILLLSLKILDYARRIVMFWVTLAFRLVFWGTLIGLGFYIYQVGFERASRDLGWVWGAAEGFVEDFSKRSAAAAANAKANENAGAGSWYMNLW